MKIIIRYTIFGVSKIFLIALTIMTTFFIIVLGVAEAYSQGVSLETMMQMMPYLLPESLRYSIPMTLLLGTTIFFARMSTSNEILALKSLGVSPWRVVWPVLVFAVVISLFSVFLNDLAVSWGRKGVTRIIAGASEQILFNRLKKDKKVEGPNGLTIMVQGVENKTLIMPTVIDNSSTRQINADQAELNLDVIAGELELILYNVTITEGKRDSYLKDIRVKQSIASVLNFDRGDKHPSEMPMKRIPEEIVLQEEEIKTNTRKMATNSAFAISLGDLDQLVSDEWKSGENLLAANNKRLHRLKTEPPRRWSSGFSCFFFVWIGAPLAIWLKLKNGNLFNSFFACFIPILIGYYPLLVAGLSLAKDGTFPPLIVWAANISLGICGCYFYRRILKY